MFRLHVLGLPLLLPYLLRTFWRSLCLELLSNLTPSVYFCTPNYPFNLPWFIFRGFLSTSLTTCKSSCLIFLPFLPFIKHSGLCYLGVGALLGFKWNDWKLLPNRFSGVPFQSSNPFVCLGVQGLSPQGSLCSFWVVLFSNQRLSLEKRLGFWLLCFGLDDLGVGVDRQLTLILFLCFHQGS